MSNPYRDCLFSLVDRLRRLTPETIRQRPREKHFQHWDPDNEWIYPEMANHLLMAAYVWATPGSPGYRDQTLGQAVECFMRHLVEAAEDHRWYHLKPGKGDPNIDRFTLVPFCEAYGLMGEALPADLRASIVSRLRGIGQVQYREYGHGRQMRGQAERLYPNMDAYYCLQMYHLHHLTGEALFQAEFNAYLHKLVQAQFPAGAWTYIGGTNECPVYHDLAVLINARLAQLTDDPRCWQQLRRSLPYYASVLSPQGVPEYYTDCWWKHSWSPQLAYAPDTLASLLGDPSHRGMGDRLRDATLQELTDLVAGRLPTSNNIAGLFIVYAAQTWQDVTPAPFFRQRVWMDENIQGPRGQFRDWSWAATARYASDTVVGAMAHTPLGAPVQALMAVTPCVETRLNGQPDSGMGRFALAITPAGTVGTTRLGEDRAEFTAEYALASCRSVWDADPFPVAWQCRQQWRLGPRTLTGRIEIVSLREQTSAPPGCVIRFGEGGRLDDVDGGWRFGPFTLKVEAPAFPCRTIEPAPTAPYLTANDAVQLRLRTQAGWSERTYAAGERFHLEIDLAFQGGTGESGAAP